MPTRLRKYATYPEVALGKPYYAEFSERESSRALQGTLPPAMPAMVPTISSPGEQSLWKVTRNTAALLWSPLFFTPPYYVLCSKYCVVDNQKLL